MKNLFIAAMLLVSLLANSANYITLGDTVRIPPRYSDGYYKLSASMTIDGMCDSWNMTCTYPEGVNVKLVNGITALDGMSVGYVDRFGAFQVYEAPLQVSAAYGTISSEIIIPGYWDYDSDGYFESYGTVKWMPGSYDLFSLNFYINPEFRNGHIIFDGTLTSGSDQRGAVLQGVRFHRDCYIWVGYLPGDMNGDDRLTIGDVSLMIDYNLRPQYYDVWQAQAADFNQDGHADINDVARLINWLLENKPSY